MTKTPKADPKALVPVPNGTTLTATKLDQYIAQGRGFLKATALSILSFSETVRDAEAELSPADFAAFCAAFGLDPKSSKYRKWKKIGQEVSRFAPFVDKTPGQWTTVHTLAVLPKTKFDLVVHDARFGPMMTAAEVQAIISDRSARQPDQLSPHLIFDLTGFDRQKKLAIFARVNDLKEEFGFRCDISKDVIKELMPAAEKAKPTLEDIIRAAR